MDYDCEAFNDPSWTFDCSNDESAWDCYEKECMTFMPLDTCFASICSNKCRYETECKIVWPGYSEDEQYCYVVDDPNWQIDCDHPDNIECEEKQCNEYTELEECKLTSCSSKCSRDERECKTVNYSYFEEPLECDDYYNPEFVYWMPG